VIVIGTSAHTLWAISLGIGLVAALAAAALLLALVMTVGRIDRSAKALLAAAGQVAGQTEYIPQLQATAPVLGQIHDEVLVLDDYMNALTDGFGGR
jgi:hypothetical protein